MRILCFTDSKNGGAWLDTLSRGRTHTVEVHPTTELKKMGSVTTSSDYVYFDVTGLSSAALRARLKALSEISRSGFGVVDRNGSVKDIADMFHRGATDYIGPALVKTGLKAARFRRVLEFSGVEGSPERQPLGSVSNLIPSGADWDEVENGQEYTFQMLYIGLDHVAEIRRKSSEDLLRSLRRSLQSILVRAFAGAGGRIWVWKEDDGILLAPFDGKNVTMLVPAMRLVLNRVLLNIEQFSVTTPISWRMGLHLGNTPYQASGQTGGIVSESLNFIFHLGERAIKPGRYVITEPALSLASTKIRSCFVPQGSFESVSMYSMKELS